MKLYKWEELPINFQTEEVRKYYDILMTKKGSLITKRLFDIVVSILMLIILSPVFLILAISIKMDSREPLFYRQTRVTQFGREFKIHKFRSMVTDADKGSLVTVSGDSRVTKVGKVIRKWRLDETSQLIDILQGTMTFVGTRPEVPKYVSAYSKTMMATLLLPAGVTSVASIYYKDEAELLDAAEDIDKVYVEEVLPGKMYYNLKSIEEYSFWYDIKVMFLTVFAIFSKEHKNNNFSDNHTGEKL